MACGPWATNETVDTLVRVIFYRDGAILMGRAKIRIRAEARLPGSRSLFLFVAGAWLMGVKCVPCPLLAAPRRRRPDLLSGLSCLVVWFGRLDPSPTGFLCRSRTGQPWQILTNRRPTTVRLHAMQVRSSVISRGKVSSQRTGLLSVNTEITSSAHTNKCPCFLCCSVI